MSGVLDRMIQRVRGTLTSVQPVQRSIYSPPAMGANGLMAEMEDVLEADGSQPIPRVEIMPGVTPSVSHDRSGAVESAGPSTESRRPFDTDSVMSVVPLPEPRKTVAGAGSKPLMPLEFLPLPLSDPRKTKDGGVSRPSTSLERPPSQKVETSSIVPGRLPPVLGGRSALERQKKSNPFDNRRLEGESSGAARTMELRPRQKRERGESFTEEHTAVHISIGSIEFRTPKVESRPQAAPFQPRVTLDQFLRGTQEAR